jgi:hypothetical protein
LATSVTPTASGIASAGDVRRLVAGISPAASTIATALWEKVNHLYRLGLSTSVKTTDDLVPYLAADMEKLAAKNGEAAKTKQQWAAIAKQQIVDNKTTALTLSDDRYIGLEGGLKFDELHELVHIASAPGGLSALKEFQNKINEGAINFFSELIAPIAGVTVVLRYTEETPVAKSFVKLLGNDPSSLYDMTFKGEIDQFFRAVGLAYVALGAKMPSGKPKSFSEKGWLAGQAEKEFRDKTLAWNTKWLTDRLPT